MEGRKKDGMLQKLRSRIGQRKTMTNHKRAWLPWAVFFAVLGVVLIASMVFYVTRLSDGSSGGSGAGNDGEGLAYGQLNLELPPPDGIMVTVEKGATVSWDGEEDTRVIGYNIYRFNGPEDEGSKINPAIVSDTVYHDDEGTMFNSYAVAPVDNNGRQGVLSIPVVAEEDPNSLTGMTPTTEPEQLEDVTFKDQPNPAGVPQNFTDCTANGMTFLGVWYLERYSEVIGGTLMVTPYYGDYCIYTFAGDSVSVYSTRHWNYGMMDVYIDGELRERIDLYSDTVQPREKVFTASGLGPGAHTIKLVCTGQKNPAAFFTFINLEAIEIK